MRLRKRLIALLMLPLLAAGCQSRPAVETATSCCGLPQLEPCCHDAEIAPSPATNIALTQFKDVEVLPLPAENIVADPETLSLAQLEGLALANNPTLAAASARVDAAFGRQIQAGLHPNPMMGYHATEVGAQGSAGAQGGFVGQRFITGGKLGLDQAMAGQRVEQAHFQLQAQEQRVLSDVRTRFYDALIAQRRVELTGELAKIGDDLVAATKKLLAGRIATDNDLLQAEIKAEQSRILLDNARNEHAAAWRRLAAVVGTPTLRTTALSGEIDANLPDFDWETTYQMVVNANPELSAALANLERTNIAIVRARKEPVPDIDLFVSVRHVDFSGDDILNIQAGIPIPVFDKNQGNIQAAQAEWMAANREVQRIELDLQDRLAVAFRRYCNARQQIDRYQQRIVPKADESLRLVTDGYEKGEVEYLMLLTAQETFYQVNLAYLDALQELWQATAAIDGQLLEGSLSNRP